MEITFLSLLIFSIIGWLILRFAICAKKDYVDFKHELLLLIPFTYALLLARGVYFPTKSPDGRMVRMVIDFSMILPFRLNFTPLTFLSERYPGWWINVFGNIVIFIPAGIIIPIYFKKINTFLKTLIAGFGLSLLIELSQLLFYDRCSDIDDLILNTLGAVIGAAVYFIFFNRKKAN